MITSRWIATAGIAVALALSACSGGSPAASQATASTGSAAAPTATTAPAQPTAAPTAAPTTAPTVAPSPTVAAEPTLAATTTPVPQQKPSGPAVGQGDIKAMAQAWAGAKSYRITMDSNDPTSKGTFLMEIVRPDREHMKATMGGQSFEFIQIGNTSYINLNGKWQKTTTSTSSGAGNLGLDPSKTVDDINKSVSDGSSLTKGSVSQVDGQPCQEWVFTGKDSSESGTVCIGLTNSLPLQFKTADGKFVMKFSDWNAPIDIEPPAM